MKVCSRLSQNFITKYLIMLENYNNIILTFRAEYSVDKEENLVYILESKRTHKLIYLLNGGLKMGAMCVKCCKNKSYEFDINNSSAQHSKLHNSRLQTINVEDLNHISTLQNTIKFGNKTN